ncbi:MAG: outer membrane beta-barrel domain-containing protein [Acidobacteriota bacterium]
MTKKLFIFGSALLGILVATNEQARAERRLNDLHKDVAVRHRRLLVKNRFEFTPLFESSIDADYKHIIGGGVKLEYHLSDMWSIGAIGVASTAINTSLTNRIINSGLPMSPDGTRTPTQDQFLDHLNSMPFHGAAYLSLTPWYGKLAAFASAYVAFDFYFQAGLSFASLTSNCPTSNVCTDTHPGVPDPNNPSNGPDLNPNNDPPLNDGTRLGLYLGGGIHVFLSDFLALDLTVRDYAFSDNPSGADYNADLYVGNNPMLGDDNRFLHHLFFGAGLSIMFPTTVKRTP